VVEASVSDAVELPEVLVPDSVAPELKLARPVEVPAEVGMVEEVEEVEEVADVAEAVASPPALQARRSGASRSDAQRGERSVGAGRIERY